MGIIQNITSEKTRNNKLLNRGISLNRYPDSRALEALGIKDNVMALLGNIGWNDYVGETHYTFETFTLEFMITICFVQDRESQIAKTHCFI